MLEGAIASAAGVDARRVAIAVIRPATSGRRLSASVDNPAVCLVGFVISAPEIDLDEIRLRLEATDGRPIDTGAVDVSLQGVGIETLDEAPSYFTLPGSLLHAVPAEAVAADTAPVDTEGGNDNPQETPKMTSNQRERLVALLAAVSVALCILACVFRACSKKRKASIETVHILGSVPVLPEAPTVMIHHPPTQHDIIHPSQHQHQQQHT